MHQNRPEEITVMINIRLKRYIIATYCETHKTMNTSSKYFYEMLLHYKEIPNKEWENLQNWKKKSYYFAVCSSA